MTRALQTLALSIALTVAAGGAARAGAQQRDTLPGAERAQRMRTERDTARTMRRGASSFRALELTDEQRTRMRSIDESYRQQLRATRDAARPDLQAARDARQRGDTAAFRAALTRVQQRRQELRTLSERYRTERLGVLTPSQRERYDRRMTLVRERLHERRAVQGRHRMLMQMRHRAHVRRLQMRRRAYIRHRMRLHHRMRMRGEQRFGPGRAWVAPPGLRRRPLPPGLRRRPLPPGLRDRQGMGTPPTLDRHELRDAQPASPPAPPLD
ncbi:MAG TPA: Spy/CpxP family protein refolding chaperone [Gemmatimonadaceae bacterium]|nr:Spy/CpxP family protein refolding chaperone [Gemmatimonadaceae bacterium]